jgi:hypothetical protein
MFKAKLVGLSELDEQEVVLEINNEKITCCAVACPYQIKIGNYYPVELEVQFSGNPIIQEAKSKEYKIKRIGRGYQYLFQGKLQGNFLDLGAFSLKISGFEQFWKLNEKFIVLIVHGIWVAFLTRDEIKEDRMKYIPKENRFSN